MTQLYQVIDYEREYSIYEIKCKTMYASTARALFVECLHLDNLTEKQKTDLSDRLKVTNVTSL